MHRFITLMYHEIVPKGSLIAGPGPVRTAQGMNDVLPAALYVWEEDFAAQMTLLREKGYTVVDPGDLKDFVSGKRAVPEKAVLITFDDLWKGGMTRAYHILKKNGFRAIAFVVRSWVFDHAQEERFGSPVCLSTGEWKEMADVFDFANHTDTLHVRGSAGTAGAELRGFVADVESCEQLTTLKGVFAYPFGEVNETMIAGLNLAGFELAFTTQPGINDASTDPLRLRRCLVPGGMDLAGFEALCAQHK